MTGKLLCPEVMPVSRCPMRIEAGSSVPCKELQPRLVIEQFQMRRPAGLKQIDDAFGLWGEVWNACLARGGAGRGAAVQQGGQGGQADACFAEEVPAGKMSAALEDRSHSIVLSPKSLVKSAVFTPKGLNPKAQGCVLATLGEATAHAPTPKGLYNPFGVEGVSSHSTQGCEYATLGFVVKPLRGFKVASSSTNF